MADDKITPSFAVEPDLPEGVAKPAPKSRRAPGRPVGATKAATAQTNDVRQALASLDMLYEIIGTGLLMIGKPLTAASWQDRSATLRDTNENALKAAPKLAKFLAGAGQTSGAITILATHAVAFGAVAMVFQMESAVQREDKGADSAGTSAPYMG